MMAEEGKAGLARTLEDVLGAGRDNTFFAPSLWASNSFVASKMATKTKEEATENN